MFPVASATVCLASAAGKDDKLSTIFLRASGLRTRFALRFFGADFFAAVPSAARFDAHLCRCASAMRLRLAALKCFLGRPRVPDDAFVDGPTPRRAVMARSIASRCCSSSEITLAMSLNPGSSNWLWLLPLDHSGTSATQTACQACRERYEAMLRNLGVRTQRRAIVSPILPWSPLGLACLVSPGDSSKVRVPDSPWIEVKILCDRTRSDLVAVLVSLNNGVQVTQGVLAPAE